MRMMGFIFAAGLLNISAVSAQVVCSDREMQNTYNFAIDHWKKVERLSFPASISLHDTHNMAPPYPPTTIFRVLFDKEVGVFEHNEAKQIRVRQKVHMSVPEDVIQEIRDHFDEILARSKGFQTEYLQQLKANDFQNSDEAFDAAMMRIVGVEAPLIRQVGLVEKIRAAKNCAEVTQVLQKYFSVASALASALEREFHGLKDIGADIPFKGNAAALENDVTELCNKSNMSRLGKFNDLTLNEANKQAQAMAFATCFSVSRSINWQDYRALVRSSLDNMFINTKNQAAIKTLVSYGLHPERRTKKFAAQIQTLCAEVASTEDLVMNKVRAIDDITAALIAK